MSVLRLFLDETFPGQSRACRWTLVAEEKVIDSGQGEPKTWPAADQFVGIAAATRARVLRLTLPDLPPAKFRAALAYAVEARIAGEPELQKIAAGRIEADGKRRVVVAEKRWIDEALRALGASGVHLAKLAAAAELAEVPRDAWCWQRAASGGYVLTGDDLLPLDGAGPETEPPAVLLLALERGGGERPRRLIICGDEPSPQQQLAWARGLGLSVQWQAGGDPLCASNTQVQAAQDLLPASASETKMSAEQSGPRRWRIAAGIAAIAGVLHLAAAAADYLWLGARTRALEREAANLLAARFPQAGAVAEPFAAFRENYARLRHAAGLPAPQDALPQLARAAPALAQMGDSALRQAQFSGGRWTLDLAPLSAAQRQQLVTALRQAGFSPIYAEQANGLRMMLSEELP